MNTLDMKTVSQVENIRVTKILQFLSQDRLEDVKIKQTFHIDLSLIRADSKFLNFATTLLITDSNIVNIKKNSKRTAAMCQNWQ